MTTKTHISHLYELRKKLHKVPEPAFKEFKTQEIIQNELKDYVNCKLSITHFSPTGLLYEYSHGSGDYILFRADMDALPITENSDCEFQSDHHGYAHCCGHDMHITILIGLIHYVVQNNIKQNLLFLFQPAEEGHGGAEHIIKTGIFNKYSIKAAYALHITGQYPTGTIGIKTGIIFGIPQEFDIEITGKAGHCATPHNGKDAFIAGIDYIQQVSHLITKNFPAQEPVIFHIGKVNAGTVRNIIPEHCKLEGTTRCLKKEVKKEINDILFRVANSIETAHQVSVKVSLLTSYDPVVNDETLVANLMQIIPPDIKVVNVDYAMVGEDFGFFTSMYPSVLFWLGSDANADLHASNFLPDEKSIPIALEIYKSILSANQ